MVRLKLAIARHMPVLVYNGKEGSTWHVPTGCPATCHAPTGRPATCHAPMARPATCHTPTGRPAIYHTPIGHGAPHAGACLQREGGAFQTLLVICCSSLYVLATS